MSHPAQEPVPRVGITLITGFLGAGKSTLIRRLLTERHNLRLVVVENEFADNSSVEKAIVTQGTGPSALEEFIELPNGCICCAAQDDLTDALQRLVDSKRGSFDHILVEASGLADPAPVAASLWVDEGVDSSLYLDAVITIVDAVNLEAWLKNTQDTRVAELARKQLAIADLVLLNKIDLLGVSKSPHALADLHRTANKFSAENSDPKLQAVSDMIRDHGCNARLIPTTRCDVEISTLLNIRAYEEGHMHETIKNIKEDHENHDDRNHTHVSSAGSLTVTFNGDSFHADKLDRVLGMMLWQDDRSADGGEQSYEIWRMKGLAVIVGEQFKMVYQSVHTLFDHSTSGITAEGDMTSVFVFIGRGLEYPTLRKHLCSALAN